MTCDICGKRIKADTAMVVVNVCGEPTRRYHGQCFAASTGPDEKTPEDAAAA